MSTSLTVGKSVVNSYNPYVTLTVTESATSATANTSTLTYSLVIYRPSSISSSASKAWSFSINGTSYSGTTTIGGSGTKTITSGTQTVSHSSDGTKTISLSLSFTFAITWSSTYMGTYSTSGTMTLTSLDRTAPTITISSSSSTNSTITIAATSNVSCNTWQYSTNGGSSYTTFNSGSATSVSKTITGLSANTTYAVRIRAYKVSNNVSAYAAKSITTLGASSITSASALTLSDDGTSCSVTFTPYSTDYYFTLTFTIGSYSVTTDRFCPASTSAYTFTDYAFTTDEWAPYITSAASASCTATLTTYADSSTTTAMGTGTKTFTVTVPSDLVPVINSVAFTEAAEDFPTAFTGTFVQSFTQLLIEADAESVYSATIASITATVESTDYDVTDGGTTGTLAASGTHTISVTATDSRGRTATEDYEIEVAAYFTPTLYLTYTTMSETLALTASGGVASVEGLNARTVTFTAVAAADESQSYTAEFDLENDGTDTYTQTYTISDDSAQTLTWNLTATITDSVNSVTVTKTTGVTALSFLSGGKGAAFFKEAESEGLEVGGDMTVNGMFYHYGRKLIGEDAAAAHNAIPRGKDLTDTYTVDEICEMISNETFDDLYVGDYFTTSITTTYGGTEEIDIMIGGFNYHLHSGSTETTTPHAICVLKDCFVTTAQMEESNTTENGYAGTVMHTTTLPVYATAIKSAIGDHVLSHQRYLSTGISSTAYSMAGAGMTGAANAASWTDVDLCLMSEPMLYGCLPCSSSRYDIFDACLQIPVFRYFPHLKGAHQGKTGSRCGFWLSAVASSTSFALRLGSGTASTGSASVSSGVRPYFLLA